MIPSGASNEQMLFLKTRKRLNNLCKNSALFDYQFNLIKNTSRSKKYLRLLESKKTYTFEMIKTKALRNFRLSQI